ncbi:MAG: pro-sigmaK processing inhibitor BofA family protein [Clostridia bacterium]|nr:pro-sigmaK processing inhibitor BofA family protein [Clostridia bacterium]
MNGKILILILAAAGAILLLSYIKNRRPVSAILLTAAQGICAFFAVNLIGALIGVHLHLNPFSAAVSALGGTAGVIFLLVMNLFTGA